MTQTSTVQLGKAGEFRVMSELLKRGADVYIPAADTRGVDAIVRKKDGSFLDVQIKTHSTDYMANWFDVYDVDQHETDRFVIIGVNMLVEPPDSWIFPADVFIEYGTRSKRSDGSHVYRLDLESRSRKHGNQVRREILEPHYLNAWHILTG